MEYRNLGKWGVKVSALGLGSYLTIGQAGSAQDDLQIVKCAYEAGVNFFDTANVYGFGAAESALGKLLAGLPRHSYVLATKVWAPMGPGPNEQGLSRKNVFEQCHASLRRLNTDYVDLYQCHRYDPATPLEETLRAMDDLVTQGKILYWGVSEWSVPQIDAAISFCEHWGLDPPVSNQPRYSLLWRQPERGIFPYCQAKGMGQIVFSPLAHGVLTGKYHADQPPSPDTRAADPAKNEIMMSLYFKPDILRKVETMADLAKSMGVLTSQLAYAWVLHNPAVSTALIGATSLKQLQENLKAAEMKIESEVATRLELWFPIQPAAVPAP